MFPEGLPIDGSTVALNVTLDTLAGVEINDEIVGRAHLLRRMLGRWVHWQHRFPFGRGGLATGRDRRKYSDNAEKPHSMLVHFVTFLQRASASPFGLSETTNVI